MLVRLTLESERHAGRMCLRLVGNRKTQQAFRTYVPNVGGQQKNQPAKEEADNVATLLSPFSLIEEDVVQMNKSKAIGIIVQCVELYHENFENKNLMILSANKQKYIHALEAHFPRRCFMHLTGIMPNESLVRSATHFYTMCLEHRLTEGSFSIRPDGTTEMKLSVLPDLLKPHLSAKSIGDYDAFSPKLFTEKLAGSIRACMGFTKGDGFYYPNTVLKKDIRDISKHPQERILAIVSKEVGDLLYGTYVYATKIDDWSMYHISDDISGKIQMRCNPFVNGGL